MNLPDLHINTSPDVTQQLAMFSGPVYALTNVVRRVNKRVDGGWVLVVALAISLLIGVVVAVAAFQSVRDVAYAVMVLFLGALGIDASKDKPKPDVPDTPPQQPPIPQIDVRKGNTNG